MNIHDYWPLEPAPSLDLDAVIGLLDLRIASFRGFAEVEHHKGSIVSPTVDLRSALGQEVIRIFMMRGIEEVLEAWDAISDDHRYEELIDAINFFWAIGIMDPTLNFTSITKAIYDGLKEAEGKSEYALMDFEGYVPALNSINDLMASLRNRSWQQNAQSTFFDGFPFLLHFLKTITIFLRLRFHSWDTFWKMYIAKDKVLQFRLKSGY
jgi:hypothetical protein